MTYVVPSHYGRMVEKISKGELLERAIEKSGLGPTELSRKIGVGYQTIRRWVLNKNFNEGNQRKCIDAMRLPDDYFSDPSAAEARGRTREASYNGWLKRSPYATNASEREKRFIARLLPDDPEFEPDDPWYDMQLWLIRNKKLNIDVDAVLAKNRAIDAEIEAEDRPKRRRKKRP